MKEKNPKIFEFERAVGNMLSSSIADLETMFGSWNIITKCILNNIKESKTPDGITNAVRDFLNNHQECLELGTIDSVEKELEKILSIKFGSHQNIKNLAKSYNIAKEDIFSIVNKKFGQDIESFNQQFTSEEKGDNLLSELQNKFEALTYGNKKQSSPPESEGDSVSSGSVSFGSLKALDLDTSQGIELLRTANLQELSSKKQKEFQNQVADRLEQSQAKIRELKQQLAQQQKPSSSPISPASIHKEADHFTNPIR